MQLRNRQSLRIAAALPCLAPALACGADAPTQNAFQEESIMTHHAKGTFEVKLQQQGEPDKAEGAQLGRMSIDKHFSGDLDAVSKGEMLSALTDVKGSSVYVAIERVSVVPDSGADRLAGVSGQMKTASRLREPRVSSRVWK